MTDDQAGKSSASNKLVLLFAFGLLAAVLCLLVYAGASVAYSESKGPFKNWMQVVDWEADGDLDVIVSHTRWEAVDISWAGIGLWLNQGDRSFQLIRDRGTGPYPFGGFASAAGDIDRDGDLDVFTQDFGIRLLLDQGGAQPGTPGTYLAFSGINTPAAYDQGYRDMGGTIKLSDLNGDGRLDAFVAGCCYGMQPRRAGADDMHAPSVSWTWINDGTQDNFVRGHIVEMDALDGRPIREAVMGDLDGDGDLDIYAAVGKPTLGTAESIGDLVLLNDGNGNLEAEQPLGDTDSTSAALGDVNQDGHLDVLVGTSTGATVWMNRGIDAAGGRPVFAPAEQNFQEDQSPGDLLQKIISTAADRLLGIYLPYGSIRTKAVFLSDLDEDGDLDALLARTWGAEIWWNDGQGVFRRDHQRFEYREDTGVAVADFDGDGAPDIFSGRNEFDYQVWWNDGQGVFSIR